MSTHLWPVTEPKFRPAPPSRYFVPNVNLSEDDLVARKMLAGLILRNQLVTVLRHMLRRARAVCVLTTAAIVSAFPGRV